jgi:diguanylate cyclase (GGDEF)-like protein
MDEASTPAAPGLRALFARSDDPYAGADIALARRFCAVTYLFGTVVVAILSLFFPPTRAIGDAGWLVAGGGYLVMLGMIGVIADKRREVGFNFLFLIGFVGLVLIAITQHGAGGRVAPYHELYMFQLIGAALMHPPRRVALFLACVVAATCAPLVYAPATAEPGEIITELLLWTGLALLMILLMRTIRSQRLELRKEGDEARLLARVDSLTNLGNRRAFDEALDAELARSRRASSALSLIVADLNGFKEINDRYGHVLGDDCLRSAAAALREAVRRPDLCFRWGGDEFAVVLTDADAKVARALAIRLEKAVSGTCRRPDGAPLTLTCGHAELDPDMSAAEAVARADATLLAMKARERRFPLAPLGDSLPV